MISLWPYSLADITYTKLCTREENSFSKINPINRPAHFMFVFLMYIKLTFNS